MGNGAVRSDQVQMPESIMGDTAQLRVWVRRAFEYTVKLPKKAKSAKTTAPARKTKKK